MSRDHACPGCGRGGMNSPLDCICEELKLAYSYGWDSAWGHSGEGHNGEYVRAGQEGRLDAAFEAGLEKFMENYRDNQTEEA